MTGRGFFILTILLLCSPGSSQPSAETVPLELHDLDGTPRSLEEYRGRIVILNFWATWCLPCREEMPLLREVGTEYAARGVELIAVSTDDKSAMEEIHRFVREQSLESPVWTGGTVADM